MILLYISHKGISIITIIIKIGAENGKNDPNHLIVGPSPTSINIYLREFALHTTVILAQPRVSRLRADVIYVDDLAGFGRVCQGWAGFGIRGNPGFSNAGIFWGPPFGEANLSHGYTEKSETSAKLCPIGRWDWTSQINVFHWSKFRPMTRWGPYCYSLPIPNLVYGYTRKCFFFRFSPKSTLFTRRPPAPPSVRRSNALCKESIR